MSFVAKTMLRSAIAGPSRFVRPQPQIIGIAASIAQQQQRLSIAKRWNSSSSSSTNDESLRLEAPQPGSKPQKIGQIEPRLSMTMTCTADDCGHRSTHEFTKRSYEKGIVIVQCPECKNRHLIADSLGWFKESMEDGRLKTVEDLLRAKGEKIRKGRVTLDGTIEYEGE